MSAAIPHEIIRLANATWETRGHARPRDAREPLLWSGLIVGFVTPHETSWGWRLGPIFVLPEYRRRGLVLAAYAARRHLPMVAFVADDNPPSRALHLRAGFANWRRGNHGWFMRREAST
jgi:GNAT superfamily N-acetyltransferase